MLNWIMFARIMLKTIRVLLPGLSGFFSCLVLFGSMPVLYAYPTDGIQHLLGKEDAVIVA